MNKLLHIARRNETHHHFNTFVTQFKLMKSLKILFVICVGIYLPLQSFAWGILGHRIVGQIADSYISEKTRVEIKKILGDESIAMASNWADFIKSDSNFRYLSPWHYINFDKDLSYDQMQNFLKTDTAVDAYVKLNFLIGELRNRSKLDLATKKMYLRLLIHIAEDVNQPLHVSAKGTTGGNDIKVTWFGAATNLHSVWDERIIEDQKLSYTEYTAAINHPTAAQRKKWLKEPLIKWLYDSYSLSNKIQADVKDPSPKLGYLYIYQNLETVNAQLLKGGVRLAGLLNDLFAK